MRQLGARRLAQAGASGRLEKESAFRKNNKNRTVTPRGVRDHLAALMES